MSDSLPESIKFIESCLKLHYSEHIASKASKQFLDSNEDSRVYIIGCLLLTLTASVQPTYTLVSERRRTITAFSQWPTSPDTVAALADAGLYQQDASRLACFHCSAKLSSHAEGLAVPAGALNCHRTASPNCYFVRFVDFVESRGADPRLRDSIVQDVGRYMKALRKLNTDLACDGLDFATSFGFDRRALAFYMTRHFMRNSGRVPDRAGDIIELAHDYAPLFHPSITDLVDVQVLLKTLKMLSGARNESGLHSVVVGRYDQQTGTWESSAQSLTREQLRLLQDLMGQVPGGGNRGRFPFT